MVLTISSYLAPIFSLLALIVAGVLAKKFMSQDPGTENMQEIAKAISEGAKAYLSSQYRILMVFIVVVFLLITFGVGSLLTAICFLVGAGFSALSGFFGMSAATRANVRTANAAKTSGMNKALSIAFSGGAVMGMSVSGLGLLGCSLIYIITRDVSVLFGFSLGASSVALFSRVGGGIYTKAADVGADLVGKVESGIPEDDPRNPATIADNVGDNVGDVAGMGADLFESYVGAIISAITLGVVAKGSGGAVFPLVLAAIGIFASIVGSFFVRGNNSNPHKSLKNGTYVAGSIVAVFSVIISYVFFQGFGEAYAIISGLVCGILIGISTEYYTSDSYKSVKLIAQQSVTGSATNIISGLAIGMKSTLAPVILVCVAIGLAYSTADLFGVALAAVGMLSTTGITVAVDAYGPIADNAGGIAQMAHLDENVRKITDKLDSVGNTTAAIGKGFAIGSAALTALALFISYAQTVGLSVIDVLQSNVIIGLFIGGMLPFLFSALTMESVSKAAQEMINEVRRQFKEIPGILEGKEKPDYKNCVAISTKAALKEMVAPGILAVASPVAVGLLLGTEALGGLLAGSVVTGVVLAIFMSNAGGAWDNAKKYIEEGNLGGKGSDPHKAAVVGDTVGDPFKDTSGPSINILIKLMTIVALVFSPLFIEYGGLLII